MNIFSNIFAENMPEALNAIASAMREWESKTCIKFVKRTSEKDYLWFFRQKGLVTNRNNVIKHRCIQYLCAETIVKDT